MKKDGTAVISEWCAYIAVALLAVAMFVQVGIHAGRKAERAEIIANNYHCILKFK